MNDAAIYTGSTFYGQQRAMLTMRQQISAYHAGKVTEAIHESLRKNNKNFPVSETIPEKTAQRLSAHKIKSSDFIIFRDAFKYGPLTISKLRERFGITRQTVFRKTQKLIDAGFLRADGNIGREIIWKWVA